MRRSLIFLIFAITLPGASAAAGPDGECTCRYKGEDVIEGQTACIATANGPSLARCEKVLNNTSWTILDQPCPTANYTPAWNNSAKLLEHTG
jgi:hypothetical protein